MAWPTDRADIPKSLRPYRNYSDELSVKNGIIYKGTQVMVPQSMQKDMLRNIHANHVGGESNIRMAREVLFWSGMRNSIQGMCNACSTCDQYGHSAPKEPVKSLPIPTGPWQIVSQDLRELEKQRYLVTVCHFSDWIEVDKLEDTLSSKVIEKTKAHFAGYRVPAICHTDNGPQFISEDYRKFFVEYGFKHTASSPYHPKGNGRAEAAVKHCGIHVEKGRWLPQRHADIQENLASRTHLLTLPVHAPTTHQNPTPHHRSTLDTHHAKL